MPSTSTRWASTLTKGRLRAALKGGRTPADIAAEVGCSENTIRDHLAKHGLLDVGSIPRTLSTDYSELRSIDLVAKRHGVSFSTARRWLLAEGLELSEAHRPARSDIDIEWAARRYDAGESLAEVALDFGIGVNTLKRRLERHGVAMRPRGPKPVAN